MARITRIHSMSLSRTPVLISEYHGDAHVEAPFPGLRLRDHHFPSFTNSRTPSAFTRVSAKEQNVFEIWFSSDRVSGLG